MSNLKYAKIEIKPEDARVVTLPTLWEQRYNELMDKMEFMLTMLQQIYCEELEREERLECYD